MEFNNNDLETNLTLHSAIKSRESDENCLKLLNENAVNIYVEDNAGCTALHWACKYSGINVVRELLKLGADVNQPDKIFAKTPLHYAISGESIEVVLLLIFNGADVNAPDAIGQSPIFYACQYKREMMILILLHYGANIEQRNAKGETVLRQLCGARTGNFIEIIKLLIVMDADVYGVSANGKTAFQCALETNLYEIIQLLLCISNQNKSRLYDEIISNFKFDFTKTFEWDETFLHLICSNYQCWVKNVGIRKELLEIINKICASDVNFDYFQIPMFETSIYNFSDCYKLQEYLTTVCFHQSRWMCAMHSDKQFNVFYTHRIIEILLKSVDVNAKNYFGETALHLLCTKSISDYEFWYCVNCLTRNGADINATDNFQMTPLHHSIIINQRNEHKQILINQSAVLHSSRRLNYFQYQPYCVNSDLYCEQLIDSITCNRICSDKTKAKFKSHAHLKSCYHMNNWKLLKKSLIKYLLYMSVNNLKNTKLLLQICLKMAIRNNFDDIVEYFLKNSYVPDARILLELCSSKITFRYASFSHQLKQSNSGSVTRPSSQLECENKLFNIAKCIVQREVECNDEIFSKLIISRRDCNVWNFSLTCTKKIDLLKEILLHSNLRLDYTNVRYKKYFHICSGRRPDEPNTLCSRISSLLMLCLIKGEHNYEKRLNDICSIPEYMNTVFFRQLLTLQKITFNNTNLPIFQFFHANENQSVIMVKNKYVIEHIFSMYLQENDPLMNMYEHLQRKVDNTLKIISLIENGVETLANIFPSYFRIHEILELLCQLLTKAELKILIQIKSIDNV